VVLDNYLFIGKMKNNYSICSICFIEFDNDVEKITTEQYTRCKCNLEYHKKCIEKWFLLKNACPVCRSRVILGSCKHFMHFLGEENTQEFYIQNDRNYIFPSFLYRHFNPSIPFFLVLGYMLWIYISTYIVMITEIISIIKNTVTPNIYISSQ
jgi:DNA-directed RNA polymerase subunit RPC12/RpoP